MSGKQMEGDNQRRRALARRARQRGQQASEAGVTLGASKQFEHLDDSDRDGPPPAGPHKPAPERGGPASAAPPPPTEQPWPLPDPATVAPAVAVAGYRDLVTDIGRRAGIDFEQARTAAQATVLALARALDETGRERLLDAVPAELHDDTPIGPSVRPPDLAGFLDEVARISRRTPEQARYQAQATLSALAEQDGNLVEALDLPADLRGLLEPPPAGGGLVAPGGGQTVALTDDELRDALAGLPYWTGGRGSLARTLALPRENLDRVLRRIERLQAETGRRPSIGRPDDTTAVITVRTSSVNAVTGLDVDLAHAIDDAIDEAGAGMAP
jgi:pterin-4a-carbinolamine dehydratase